MPAVIKHKLLPDCMSALSLQENYETYIMLLQSIGQQPVETYLHNMAKDGTWGDGTTLLAASMHYRRQIIVYSDESKKPIFLSETFNDSQPFRLGHTGGNHYVSLLPASLPNTLMSGTHSSLSAMTKNKDDVVTSMQHVQCLPDTSQHSNKSEFNAFDKKILMKRKLKFPWLMAAGDGALRAACSAYYSHRSLPKGIKGVFINTPFTKWAKSTGSDPKNNKLLKHDVSGIHKTALACNDEGRKISGQHTSVYGMLHKQSLDQQKINLQRMSDFADAAYYLFKQEIPHTTNYDSLLSLLSRLDGSHNIEQFMAASPENATYRSHNTATELLSATATWLQDKILSSIRS
jgi:OTU-like cysteine protease